MLVGTIIPVLGTDKKEKVNLFVSGKRLKDTNTNTKSGKDGKKRPKNNKSKNKKSKNNNDKPNPRPNLLTNTVNKRPITTQAGIDPQEKTFDDATGGVINDGLLPHNNNNIDELMAWHGMAIIADEPSGSGPTSGGRVLSVSVTVGYPDGTIRTRTVGCCGDGGYSKCNELLSTPVAEYCTQYYECFGADDGGYQGILYNAVRAYVSQDCANNENCDIAKTYGWPMNSWCVGSVKDMSRLFLGMSTFNENISGWNTSSVTTMRSMFDSASLFNGDLSNFDTSSVTDMSYMFRYASDFNGDLSNFNTSRVTNMNSMFFLATSFNREVSNFNTSRVTRMDNMFGDAAAFNQDVSSFDTSSVTDMGYMFAFASSFNQDLCSWQDSFPYTNKAGDIFTNSGCTYQDTPNATQKGPFCASNCQ